MNGINQRLHFSSKLLSLLLCLSFIAGCSITPTAVTNESQLNNTYKGLHQAIDSQEQINHKVTLAEAIARTLKYNLDHKVQLRVINLFEVVYRNSNQAD